MINDLINHRNTHFSDMKVINDFLLLLAKVLAEFKTTERYKYDITIESDEDDYTETVIKLLYKFDVDNVYFPLNQPKQKNRRKCEIGVYLNPDHNQYLICIESKFLEKNDYVTGKYGAIKRFKALEHGISHSNKQVSKPIPENAIIGFSNSVLFDQILIKINNTILKLSKRQAKDEYDLKWCSDECLIQGSNEKLPILKSTHTRIDGSPLTLHHFWVDICN